LENFCVYVFLDPMKPGIYSHGDYRFEFEPIYIGKGLKNRPKKHFYRYKTGKSYFYNKFRSIIDSGQVPIWSIIKEDLTEIEAFEEEKRLIKMIGRKCNGGTLTNLSEGGEGQTGFKHSEDSKLKISMTIKQNESWRETMKSVEYRDKISRSLIGHDGYGKGIPRTDDVKNKIRESVSGHRNHFFGKKHSDELKKNMSLKNSGIGNPNSKSYTIRHDEDILKFNGRSELKLFINEYNKTNNLSGPNRVSVDGLINRGKSKCFELISIDRL
jgi:hypothetical protein